MEIDHFHRYFYLPQESYHKSNKKRKNEKMHYFIKIIFWYKKDIPTKGLVIEIEERELIYHPVQLITNRKITKSIVWSMSQGLWNFPKELPPDLVTVAVKYFCISL